jgi:hypothetical protein
MAEDKVEPREINWRQLLPWTAIFQGFRVALDLNKLLLAGLGIILMAFAWWFLSLVFFAMDSKPPQWPSRYLTDYQGKDPWAHFKSDREAWNLLHEAAGPDDSAEKYEPEDLASSAEELRILKVAVDAVAARASKGKSLHEVRADARAGLLTVEVFNEKGDKEEKKVPDETIEKAWQLRNNPAKPAGRMRTWPFFEKRGSNPYLLVTGQAGKVAEDGTLRTVPWDKGHFVEWLATEEAPVVLEPLIKLLRPVVYFFNPHASAGARFYFLLVMIATIAIWGWIGGAITRIAVVQVARQEKIGVREALSFAKKRYLSYISAPLFPLVFVAVIVLGMIIFGVFHMIPILGEIIDSGLWCLMLLAGLGIIVALIGLVGWPLMSATVSAEGTDSWEAVSRSYSYVFGAVWHYLFYGAIAVVYGAVLIFFVGFVGSATVYFAKWGVEQTPFIQTANRDPSFLFAYAPTSFEWRTLLLQGAKVDNQLIVEDGQIKENAWKKFVGRDSEYEGRDRMTWYNQVAAFMVMLWLFLFFLLILGFGYSYFWSASTIVYLLMRRKVDDTEIDEVYLEEEDQESPYSAGATFTPPKPAAPAPAAGNVTMVEAPTLRTAPQEQPAPPPPAASGDGNPPQSGNPS